MARDTIGAMSTSPSTTPRPGTEPAAAPIVVVMGVAACGKSTVGRLLAARLGLPFLEGDDFHPAANVAKMAAGRPLEDTDRAPWLAALAARIGDLSEAGSGAVLSCSALKREYRDVLRRAVPGAWFLHLALDRDTARARIHARAGHFMPPVLLDSQYEALEPLAADEAGMTVDAAEDASAYLDGALAALAAPAASTAP